MGGVIVSSRYSKVETKSGDLSLWIKRDSVRVRGNIYKVCQCGDRRRTKSGTDEQLHTR